MEIFKTIPMNTRGIDYVVGDIHGAFAILEKALAAVGFNPSTDRIFTPGDLIDRGSESVRVTDFLKLPYVHSTLGNHDYDFLTRSPDEIRALAETNYNGMGWALRVPDQQIIEIQEALSSLPIAMEIETHKGTVGIVHGDVPRGMTWQEFIQALQQGSLSAFEAAMNGKSRIQTRDTSGVKGVGRLFVGHTVQWSGPKKYGNVYAIDTGAVFAERPRGRGAVTVANINGDTKFHVQPAQKQSAFDRFLASFLPLRPITQSLQIL